MARAVAIGTGILIAATGSVGVLVARRAADDRFVNDLWRTLEREPPSSERFDPAMVEGLPAPARRYFHHAIGPGTPLATKLRWRWSGEMKPGAGLPWLDLTSEQISVAHRGYVWRARAGRGPLFVTAVDHYLAGEARMRVALFGLLPVINATGPDIAKSALGRAAAEALILPSSLLPGPRVQIDGVDDEHFTATLDLQGNRIPLTVRVDEVGRVRELTLPRWGNLTDDGSYREIPYGGVVEAETTVDGYTMPSCIRLGWWYGTDRFLEVVHLRLDAAEYA